MKLRLTPFVAFETPDDTGAAATPEPVAAPAPVAAPPAAAPWAQDLAAAFTDDAERGRVDSFMREKYQPYVTKLEQEYAPARDLYTSLQGDDSLETYLGLAEQLYGEDVAELLAQTIISKYEDADTAAPVAPPAAAAELPAHIQEMYAEYEANKTRDEYWSEMKRVQAADARVDPELFHPFVAGSDGDFDAALEQYAVWHAKAYPAAPAAEVPPPPTPLGSDHVGGPTPPVAQRYDSLDAALDDTLAEMRANRQAPPPVVGSA